jgi:hypothetical protein
VPLTPVLEAHHSECRDVIKVAEQRGAGQSPVLSPASAPRSADDHVAVALARAAQVVQLVENITRQCNEIGTFPIRATLGLPVVGQGGRDRCEGLSGN